MSSNDADGERDPFPMRSAEAAALAGGTQSGAWNKMDTTTDSPVSNNNGGGKKNTKKRKKKITLVTSKTVTSTHASITFSKSGSGPAPPPPSSSSGSAILDEDFLEDSSDEEEEDEDYDDFLDRPMDHSRYSPNRPDAVFSFARDYLLHCRCRHLSRMFGRVFRRLYGNDVPLGEIYRVLILSSTLFFMIGGYWLLRSLKDPVLTALCGVSVIPKAKMTSVVVVLGVVSVYNKLLSSSIPRHKLFYLFGTFYFVVFASISMLLTDPIIGLPNEVPNPNRLLGWISYCSIESFGSVMVSLFWSYANSVISLESAKASYGLMVATAQVGSIIGPTIVNSYVGTIGVANCYLIGASCMLLLQGTMATYVHLYGTGTGGQSGKQVEDGKSSKAPKKDKTGILEGLFLFARYNYVKGIFAISCLFMVEVTIVDYTMKVLAKDHFAALHPCRPGFSCWDAATDSAVGLSADATSAFTTFMGLFGQATNTLSFLMSLLGTSAVIRTLGLRLSLLLFPSLCLIIIIIVRMQPTLWVVFAAMMMLKASSYALNNPTKEILYQPTSSTVKYKAKSWIDIFGARGSKALGSVVTNAFSQSTAEVLVANGSLVGMAVATFLIFNARYMGRTFDEYIASGYIVGREEEEEQDKEFLDLAIHQNEGKGADGGTSCAIYDDGEVGALEEGQSQDEDDEDEDLDDLIGGGGGGGVGNRAKANEKSADIVQI